MFKYFDYLDDLKDFSEDQKVLALKIKFKLTFEESNHIFEVWKKEQVNTNEIKSISKVGKYHLQRISRILQTARLSFFNRHTQQVDQRPKDTQRD